MTDQPKRPRAATILTRARIRDAYQAGKTVEQIALDEQLAARTVAEHLNAAGIRRPPGRRRLPDTGDLKVDAHRHRQRAAYAEAKRAREATRGGE